jgi:hypothetical protein
MDWAAVSSEIVEEQPRVLRLRLAQKTRQISVVGQFEEAILYSLKHSCIFGRLLHD